MRSAAQASDDGVSRPHPPVSCCAGSPRSASPAAALVGVAAAIDGEFDLSFLAEVSHGTRASTEVAGRSGDRRRAPARHRARCVRLRARPGPARDPGVARRRRARRRAPRDRAGARAPRRRARLASRGNGVGAVRCGCRRQDAPVVGAGGRAARCVDLDPYAAAAWFELAETRAPDERTRAHLLIRLAGAQCASRRRARDADPPRRARDRAPTRRPSISSSTRRRCATPIWASMPPLPKDERIALLDEGAAAASDPGVARSCSPRLATELAPTEHWRTRPCPRRRGADEVRATPPTVPSRPRCTCGTSRRRARRQPRRTARDTCVSCSRRLRRLTTWSSASSPAGCPRPPRSRRPSSTRPTRISTAAFEIAASADVPVLEYNAGCMRVWRTGLDGDLEDAEQLALGSDAVRDPARDPERHDAARSAGRRHSLASRPVLGDAAPLLRVTSDSEGVGVSILVARGARLLDARLGPTLVDLLRTTASANDFEDLPQGAHWSACARRGGGGRVHARRSRCRPRRYALLEPFATQIAFNGSWVVAPVAYGAALGAAAADDPRPTTLFEHAVGVCDRMRAPVLRARTEMAWSHVLERRGGSAPAKSSIAASNAGRPRDLRRAPRRRARRVDAVTSADDEQRVAAGAQAEAASAPGVPLVDDLRDRRVESLPAASRRGRR